MKKIFHSLAVASLLLTVPLASCDKKLDINPKDSIDAANALNTSADVEAALVGAYDGLSDNDLYVGNIPFISELLADNGEIDFVGTYVQPRQFFQKSVLVNNSFVAGVWNNAYNTINIANNVLANLDKVTASRKDRVEGEAKFLRAAMHFELVRLFGKDWNDGSPQSNLGVPLVLTPTKQLDASVQVPRNTVAEVYAQVIKDFQDAEAKIPASNGFFATKASAAGMLARVYLQQSRFADAAAAANRVIASGRYSLVSSYADEFTTTTNTSEDVFAMQVTSQDNTTDNLNSYFSGSQRGDIEVLQPHLDLYGPTDERGEFFDAPYSLKFDQQYGNVKVMRLAEMYLVRAEGNFRAGGTPVGATPLADVNTVRARAGATLLTAVTLPQILLERRRELAFEGFRLHDVKRNKENVGTLPYNSPQLVLPIPQRELDVNPNLKQNPGY
ncbi:MULTISPECIES: RagB/SusD family nutrient uptake outer membrane protein [Hymenobacter]|uniref:RagB/SusD family nutrient uptake outer membrane protein n=1 Tax=Hymenobacter jejuensis TaxID=2502781 RepID=A0A5B8A143_9BACT|nr:MULTISPECIES: RagB/SusD family nutrient uptake outer membrane protein [Hymenobacter]MBC6990479.1 RagB/SusD family nutrient uptake outer membrane protein [Hymenobacter sp. BT491]QDA61101.1 RagB/SusD family nutrient uptake outer membrane protein [Hymenobacter jejuensis]